MPRGRKRVCLLCGKPIEDNNDSVPYKGRYQKRKREDFLSQKQN